MANLFEQNRNYVLGDDELNLIGDRDKLAQWRHKGMGPAFYRLGRKIIYRGADLNAWAEANRVEPWPRVPCCHGQFLSARHDRAPDGADRANGCKVLMSSLSDFGTCL